MHELLDAQPASSRQPGADAVKCGEQHSDSYKLPAHVAIIPDGNRRWARRAGLSIQEGHARGFLSVAPTILRHLYARAIRTTTLWLFSTDNWRRSRVEIDHLMALYERFLRQLVPEFKQAGIQMRHLGVTHRLPRSLADTIERVQTDTAGLSAGCFNFALDYGSHTDLVALLRRAAALGLAPEDIDDHVVTRLLQEEYMDMPAPDLIVRTSGERRLSGFMPLHTPYSELFFSEMLFPELTCQEIDAALGWYCSRQRRFGQ
jgi:undecaprenyl diphosphate synthase